MTAFHRRSPIAFAHRGGRAHFPENTLDAFRYALKSGLTAVETDAWLTSDGEVVLDHDGVLKRFFGMSRKPIARVLRHSLPEHVPTLGELCEVIGPEVDLHIDVKDHSDELTERVVEEFGKHLPDSFDRLWLAEDSSRMPSGDWPAKASALNNQMHLVMSTKRRHFHLPGPDFAKHAKTAGFHVINIPAKDWDKELVDIVHGEGLLCFGYNVQSDPAISKAIALGLDGIYSDHVDRLLDALKKMDP